MFCPNCGSQLDNNPRFCPFCGKDLLTTMSYPQSSNRPVMQQVPGTARPDGSLKSANMRLQNAKNTPHKKGNKRRKWLVALGLILVLALLSRLGSRNSGNERNIDDEDYQVSEHSEETTDMPEFPQVGVLGWVMTRPDFRGRHLGRSVSVAAMHRLYEAGYRVFSLLTDDFRLAAVKTYLDLGWNPWLYLPEMEGRWRALAETLKRDYDSLGALPEKCEFPGKKP